jgi:hypothetical protein
MLFDASLIGLAQFKVACSRGVAVSAGSGGTPLPDESLTSFILPVRWDKTLPFIGAVSSHS